VYPTDSIICFKLQGMEWPDPAVRNVILRAARNGGLQEFQTLLGTFDVNFQADATAHSEDDLVPTVDRYALDHGIIAEWKPKILENALPAFHEGRTPLHMAASNGQVDIVRHICGVQHPRRVDMNITDKFGYTALHLAAHSQHINRDKVIAEMLKMVDIDPNVVAMKMGNGKLSSHADTDKPSWNDTALHFATYLGFPRTVEQLLAWCPTSGPYQGKTIDITGKNKRGFTALHQAVNNAEMSTAVPITRALLNFINKHEPDAINILDNKRQTALHIAVKRASYKVVNILLREGFDHIKADERDESGMVPMDIAVQAADYKLVLMLQSYFEATGLYGNREVYGNAANAILVGAALLASVTYAAWLQPPFGIDTTTSSFPSYSAIKDHWEIQLFWVFNSLSFFFAMATFLAAAGASIPSKGITLAHIRGAVHMASFYLVVSISCAMGAFTTAGFVILPHAMKYRGNMIGTVALGGIVCLFSLFLFLHKLLKAASLYYFCVDFIVRAWLSRCVLDPLSDRIMKLKYVERVVKSFNLVVNPDIMQDPPTYSDWMERVRANRQMHQQ
jgi:ankyrin repeat protein